MPRRRATPAPEPPPIGEPEATPGAAPDAKPAEPTMVEKPEPTASEWAARRERLLATVPPPEKRPASLYGKLAQILGLIPTVEKRGVNDFHKYSYAKESDLVEAVRPLLSEYGIFFWWSVVSHERRIQVKTRGENAGAEAETLSVIEVEFKFIDADGNATEPQRVEAYGDDPIDKGVYKALTGAVKYALMKTFLIATGDDPEADKAADRRGASYEARSRVDVRPARQQRPAMPGGRQNTPSAPQGQSLADLLKASGVRDSASAAVLIGEVLGETVPMEGEDKAAALQAYLRGIDPDKMGKLIHDLRKRLETPAEAAAELPTDGTDLEKGPATGGEGDTDADRSSMEADEAL